MKKRSKNEREVEKVDVKFVHPEACESFADGADHEKA
jgi:hypothetical protein